MLWQQCLQQLEHHFSEQDINTWLRTLHPQRHDRILFLLAPNPFVLKHVHENFIAQVVSVVRSLTSDPDFQVILQIGTSDIAPPPVHQYQSMADNPHITEGYSASSQPPPVVPISTHSFPSGANIDQSPSQSEFVGNISKKMVFDNFIEGNSNQLARAASMQVGDNPGHAYNPLFIYGGVGLGKTHLMHAVGNAILNKQPNAKVLYLHSEKFVNDMVSGLRNNTIDRFKAYYRNVDALLIDDIQFFAKKERSMEEFFHTFNALLEGQKQIILTSDRFPREVEGIDDRLRSRFNWGLTVQVESPELETRVAILRKKGEEAGIIIPNDVAFFVAERFRSNIRDLEGALQRIAASVRLRNQTDISLDFVQDVLRDQLASQARMVTMHNIKKITAKYYNIRTSDLDSKKRTRSIARPRQVAMALSKELTSHSLPEIGDEFGGRDHTTVLHGCRKIKELRETDTRLDEDYRILKRTLVS